MEFIFEVLSFLMHGVGYVIVGFVALILFVMIFGKKVHWRYKAEGYCEAFEDNKIKLKLRDIDKQGQSLRLRGQLLEGFQHQTIDFLLNGFRIATIPKADNDGTKRLEVTDLNINEPKRGDVISVRVAGKEIYSEKLI